jgi:hypothetical protein
MQIPSALSNAVAKAQQNGVVASCFNFFQGRATTFAIVFTVTGIILAFQGKLDANYSLFVTAIQGLVFAHSCKEDWHEQKMTELQLVDEGKPPVVPASAAVVVKVNDKSDQQSDPKAVVLT